MGAIFTDCVKLKECPRCLQKKGQPCRKPSGGKLYPPHNDRVKLVNSGRIEKVKLNL